MKAVVNKFWQLPEHNNTCFLANTTFPDRGAVVGYVYKGLDKETRNCVMKNAVGRAMSISKVNRVVVIGIDIERKDYPYSVAACYFNEEDNNLSE